MLVPTFLIHFFINFFDSLSSQQSLPSISDNLNLYTSSPPLPSLTPTFLFSFHPRVDFPFPRYSQQFKRRRVSELSQDGGGSTVARLQLPRRPTPSTRRVRVEVHRRGPSRRRRRSTPATRRPTPATRRSTPASRPRRRRLLRDVARLVEAGGVERRLAVATRSDLGGVLRR